MGTCSSGEDLVVKARKPYTITKQREKWTEEEQNKFLEALKLYGRAWQSIEVHELKCRQVWIGPLPGLGIHKEYTSEHIGTKTAVQIRSHAQKFFSKLEKEAVAKGIPLGDVHDIQIPPPRPKRKPNKPYPRKICDGVVSSYVERKDGRRTSFSSLCSKRTTDLELSDHIEKHARNQRLERTKDISIDNKFSESLSYFQWEGKTPVDASVSEEFVLSDKPKDDEDNLIVKENVQDDKYMDIGSLYRLSIDTEVKLTEEIKISQKQLRNCRMPMRNEVGSSKNYPKHVPVHSIDEHNNGSVENRSADATNVTSISDKAEVHTSLNFGTIPCISAAAELNNSSSVSSVQRPFATFPPFMQFLGTQDACRSSSNISSTFSSLIISTLVQNPAVHSAASLAAFFCPTADIETPIGYASGTFVGGMPMGHTNPSPSMAAIAAATVAAASAWWGTHGMLPFYHPFQSCLAFAPAPTNTIPRTETTQTTEDNEGREVEVAHGHLPINQQNVDPQCSEALGTKSADPLSSLVSDDDQERGMAHAVQQKSPAHNHPNSSPDSHLPESIKARSKKKVDHSSCGSNAFTNSEMEKGKVLKNLEEGKGEPTDVKLTHPSSMDISNHRPRGNIINMSESWKEVSEEGRLAFQALFSRDILPQSFSLAHTEGVMKKGEEVVAPPAELNSDACAPAGNCHAHVADRNCSAHQGIKIGRDPLNNGIRGEGKLKSHRTGFKPYKRCSMEAKENKGEPGEEKCNKRIHLEGKTSM